MKFRCLNGHHYRRTILYCTIGDKMAEHAREVIYNPLYSMKYHLLLIFGLLLGLLPTTVSRAQSSSPNVIVFIADDAGWRDFGCYGNSAIRTPNIDGLAQEGMRFDQVFLTSPQCSPTRTSLLAGQYAHTLRTEDLHTPLGEEHMILPASLFGRHSGNPTRFGFVLG